MAYAQARLPSPRRHNLSNAIDNAIQQAVNGLRVAGYSWAEIGARLGITRQAAQQAGPSTMKADHWAARSSTAA